MTDPNNTAREEEPFKDITLEPGIYDFTPQIRDHIANETPLSDEISNVLRTFKKDYDFDEDIKERGRETILKEMDDVLEVFNFEEAKKAFNEGVTHTQTINPEEKIKSFPVVFLFIPRRKEATALHGQGCAINISTIKHNDSKIETPYEKIVALSAHESTHLFLAQLGVRPPEEEKNVKEGIYDFLWEEGLTTYMEPTHADYHDTVINDSKLWISIIDRWTKTDDPKTKNDLLHECMEPAYIEWGPKDGSHYDFSDWNNKDLDNLFLKGFRRMTGVGYHIGSYLWRKQIEKGNSLKDLVLAGSGNMEQWIKDEIKEESGRYWDRTNDLRNVNAML